MWLEVVDAAVDVMEIICVVGSSFTFTKRIAGLVCCTRISF